MMNVNFPHIATASALLILNTSLYALNFDRQPSNESPQEMLQLINQVRTQARNCGHQHFDAAPPLTWSDILTRSAKQHADDMAQHNYFAHENQNGQTVQHRALAAGYPTAFVGENISAGHENAQKTIQSWLNSTGHCANLMNPKYTEIGMAFSYHANSQYGYYWVQNFGNPNIKAVMK